MWFVIRVRCKGMRSYSWGRGVVELVVHPLAEPKVGGLNHYTDMHFPLAKNSLSTESKALIISSDKQDYPKYVSYEIGFLC
jgi:hypothetical protein